MAVQKETIPGRLYNERLSYPPTSAIPFFLPSHVVTCLAHKKLQQSKWSQFSALSESDADRNLMLPSPSAGDGSSRPFRCLGPPQFSLALSICAPSLSMPAGGKVLFFGTC